MLMAKVIGTVVCTVKEERIRGIKILALQPLDARGRDHGSPFAAVDAIGCGEGEIVIYAKSKEASFCFPETYPCCDAGITAKIDTINLMEEETR